MFIPIWLLAIVGYLFIAALVDRNSFRNQLLELERNSTRDKWWEDTYSDGSSD